MAGPPDLVAPRYLHIPDYDPNRTLGPEVAAVATLAGFPPDPEQRMLLDAAFALDKRGRSVAFEVVVIAPRQNLKTGLFKQGALGQLFVRNERMIVYSAHEFDTANEMLGDLEELISGSDVLRKRVKLTARSKVASHGAVPEIRLHPPRGERVGARLKVKTRTSGGGRGLAGRKVFLDEAFAVQSSQVGALLPIMLAQPDAQVWIGSSACRRESAWLWDVVQRGRAGNDPRMIYAEWCAPPPEDVCAEGEKCDHARGKPGCACDEEDVLRSVHSAITRGRIQVQTVADLRKTMPPEEYAREIMGWHDEPDELEHVITPGLWSTLADPESGCHGRVAFAIEMSPERRVSITVGGRRADGKAHGEITGRDGVLDTNLTPEAAPKRLVELVDEWGPVAVMIDPAAPAGSLIPAIEEAGLKVSSEPKPGTREVLVKMTATETAQACGAFFDLAHNDGLRHPDQTPANDAVAGAKRRDRGDGAFTWSRKTSLVDISPVVGMSNAIYGFTAYDAPPAPAPAATTEQVQTETNDLATAGF